MSLTRCCLVLVTACGFEHGALRRDAPGPAEAGIDAPADTNMTTVDAAVDAGPIVCTLDGFTCLGVATAVVCNDACWARCTRTVAGDHAAADSACTAWGGKLAPLRTMQDHQCLVQTLYPGNASWIGLEQSNNAATPTSEWTWNGDGIAISFDVWAASQPDDANGNENGGEQCAYVNAQGEWHDVSCTFDFTRFACRK